MLQQSVPEWYRICDASLLTTLYTIIKSGLVVGSMHLFPDGYGKKQEISYKVRPPSHTTIFMRPRKMEALYVMYANGKAEMKTMLNEKIRICFISLTFLRVHRSTRFYSIELSSQRDNIMTTGQRYANMATATSFRSDVPVTIIVNSL